MLHNLPTIIFSFLHELASMNPTCQNTHKKHDFINTILKHSIGEMQIKLFFKKALLNAKQRIMLNL